jgi:hypothetical protein
MRDSSGVFHFCYTHGMKKDFSQELEQDTAINVTLMVQDSVSGKFLLFTSIEEYEEDFCHVLSFKVDMSKNLSLQLARYLSENHLSLISYRELAKATNVSFSLIDGTPGTESFDVCLHVQVDIIDRDKLNSDIAAASFVDLAELRAKLSVDSVRVTGLGIAKLISERNVLKL